MTNNNLTEEELNGLAEEMQLCANRCRHQGWEGNAREYDQIICALRELQQRRNADRDYQRALEAANPKITCPRCGKTTTHPEGWHYCHAGDIKNDQ
ncbi:TPA: hypothetical protein ACP4WM_000235 [Escherichia coli]|uniref:hypothetical protein n=1 Tax=Escherichia coli TaxID=562 RepID=UPI0006A00A62|nr:hypothetical protein [Escherichia coli]EFH2872237.1 hypothetical protein [Escherichia coli]EFH7367358.1 hypothetical protein [Escherichia coli]EGI7151014.1 hypothetical protein [Escherichia coli]EHW7469839.1 hypothetical protein [Escherichia coli]EHX8040610.1 hypothetical protein [Escherichia coli]